MNADLVISLVRTALQMGSASVLATGLVTGDQWTAISGGLVAAVAVVWTIIARRTKA